ncbi:hypothetical protein [Pseudomonas sp. PH1b]|uniref:hypothetical protein n=1 Tax=Pseudomonas sp. PH1b TaxID=1397282 RepID=UPI00046AD39A|nr:hypothetical protein [Pseudomonas sp. PH1b]BFD39713.1 hypothetical protein FFPRI1PSEUD_12120 [Pseudomonas sp. FFPRI_1]
MYESKDQPILSRLLFFRRMCMHGLVVLALIGFSILLGISGLLYFEQDVSLHDAVFDAAMILGGISPINMPETPGGKLFFASYGLYTNLVFAATLGLILSPVAHRLLHKFHYDEADDETP